MHINRFVSFHTHRPSFLYQVFCAWICFRFYQSLLIADKVWHASSIQCWQLEWFYMPGNKSTRIHAQSKALVPWPQLISYRHSYSTPPTVSLFYCQNRYTSTSMLAYARIELGVISHSSLISPERKEPGVVTFAAISPAIVKASTLHYYEYLTRENPRRNLPCDRAQEHVTINKLITAGRLTVA